MPAIGALFDDDDGAGPGSEATSSNRRRSSRWTTASRERPQGRLVPLDAEPLRRSRRARSTSSASTADLRQYVSAFAERRVLGARALSASTSDADAGQQVPFYLMPTLGGQRHAARLPRVPLPRPARAAAAGRVPLRDLVRASTARCSTTPARSPMRRADLELHATSSATTASASASTPTTASSCASMPAFGSRDGKHLYIVVRRHASERAASRGVGGRGLSRRPSPRHVGVGAAAPRFYPDDPLWVDDDKALDASKRRADRGHQRLRLRRQHLRASRASGATCAR